MMRINSGKIRKIIHRAGFVQTRYNMYSLYIRRWAGGPCFLRSFIISYETIQPADTLLRRIYFVLFSLSIFLLPYVFIISLLYSILYNIFSLRLVSQADSERVRRGGEILIIFFFFLTKTKIYYCSFVRIHRRNNMT